MESISCGSIRFTSEAICELDGTQVMVSIAKDDIVSAEICFGQAVERPILHFIAGIITCLLGLSFGFMPLVDLISGRYIPHLYAACSFVALALTLVPVGIYIIYPIFKRRYYITVYTRNDYRKLRIEKSTPSEVINAGNNMGYTITKRTEP